MAVQGRPEAFSGGFLNNHESGCSVSGKAFWNGCPVGKGIQAAEEAVFWMLAAGCLFGLLYRFNNGAVRNYIVCGMGTGMVLYRWLLSSMVVRWMLAVLRPIRQIVRIFKTFVKNTGNTLQSAAAKRTIKGRKLQQRQGEHDDS